VSRVKVIQSKLKKKYSYNITLKYNKTERMDIIYFKETFERIQTKKHDDFTPIKTDSIST